MKKIIFSLLGLLFIVPALEAASRDKSEIKRTFPSAKQEVLGTMTVNGRTFKVVTPPSANKKIATRAAEITPIIKDAPGTTQNYCKDVVGYGMGQPIQGYAVASSVNWDGDDAYFYDIITAAPIGSYVKATREGNELILPMNQTVLDYDDEEYVLNFGLLRPVFSEVNGDISVWFEYSDDYDYVTYTIDGSGSMELKSPEAKYTSEGFSPSYYGFPDYVIGYYYNDDYVWAGYCDVFQIYDEFNFPRVEMPADIDTTSMTYVNEYGMGVIVTVGITEDALYFKGLSAFAPNAVFKADIVENGTRLAVEPNQYVGIEAGLYYIITSTVTEDSNGNMDIASYDEPAYFVVERDETGKILSISADPDSPNFLAFNDDPFFFYPMDSFKDLNLTVQESFEGIPSTPYGAFYEDYSTMMGANYIFFRLSSFAYNGNIIDVNNLYYQIFVNGDPFEFEQTEGINLLGEEITMYRGIKEPTDLVPYTFANDVDLYEDMGGTFVVALYSEGIETVGVQAVYFCNGVETRSGLVTIDVETGEETITPGSGTKVENISMDDVVSIEYFDLNGVRVSNPDKGLFIKKYNLSSGKSVSRSVFRR